nr:GTP-binding protein [Halomonas alkalisoli]
MTQYREAQFELFLPCPAALSSAEVPRALRRQERVFIGQHLDEARIRQALDECLVSEAELLAGKQAWASLPDLFPAWE